MAEFKITIKCMWNSESGDFEMLTGDEEHIQEKDEDDDGEESE